MSAHLYDPRTIPPEPDDWDARPGYEAERAYYEGEDGHECPVCKDPKPLHRLGCWMAGDFTSASHYDPAEHHLPEHLS